LRIRPNQEYGALGVAFRVAGIQPGRDVRRLTSGCVAEIGLPWSRIIKLFIFSSLREAFRAESQAGVDPARHRVYTCENSGKSNRQNYDTIPIVLSVLPDTLVH
jgi:hypothetical protein